MDVDRLAEIEEGIRQLEILFADREPTAAECAEWFCQEFGRLWTMAQAPDSKDQFVSWAELDPKEREIWSHVVANYERWRGRRADDG